MDVCGFIMHVKEAIHNSNPDVNLHDVKSLSLEALSAELKKYESW